MANMRDIRLRMKSIAQSLQITSAMKLISTSKLRRARIQLNQTEPYFDKILDTMKHIISLSEDVRDFFVTQHSRTDGKPRRAFLVMTSDKGLAGGFNHNVIKLAESCLCSTETDFILLLGIIGSRYFFGKQFPILENFKHSISVPTVFEAREISDFILGKYRDKTIDEFYIVYTRMYSSVKLIPEVLKILPLEKKSFESSVGAKEKYDSGLEYIPSVRDVWNIILPKYLAGVVYGAMVESFASEQSARMTAMDNASGNAQEMLDRLKLSYSRLRQSAITQEVSEIVAGAAALNS